jgi:Spy/CpxP family protein refolding chaperone
MRLIRVCAAAVLAAGVSAATAQPPGGGRGGFGGGMMGGGAGPAQLVASKTVQTALKLTDEQVGKLKEWGQEFGRKQFEGMRERFQELQGMEPAERQAKMAGWQAEASEKAYKELAEVLKPEQVARMKQIEVQVAGPRAFTMPEVAKALKLTDDQKDKLKDAQQAMQREVFELMQEAGFRPGERPDPAKMQEVNKKRAGLEKEFMAKAREALTAEQQDAWKGVIGEPVDVAKVQEESRPQFPRKKKDD